MKKISILSLLFVLLASMSYAQKESTAPAQTDSTSVKTRSGSRHEHNGKNPGTSEKPGPNGDRGKTPGVSTKPETTKGRVEIKDPEKLATHIEQQINNNSKPVTETVGDKGTINWTEQYVEATGQCVVNYEKFPNKVQAELLAKRGALVVAQANLLETMSAVRVVRETTVKDLMLENDQVKTRIEGTVKGTKPVAPATITDGVAEITIRVPLTGVNSLEDHVADAADSHSKTANREMSAFGKEVQQEPPVAPKEAEAIQNQVVIRLPEGTKVSPSMYPTFVDKDGKIIADFSQQFNGVKGKVMPYLQVGKQLMQDFNVQKGVTFLDGIMKSDGTIQLDPDNILPEAKPKVKKWLNVLGTVGKVLLKILL